MGRIHELDYNSFAAVKVQSYMYRATKAYVATQARGQRVVDSTIELDCCFACPIRIRDTGSNATFPVGPVPVV